MEVSKISKTTHIHLWHEMNADNSPLEPMHCAKNQTKTTLTTEKERLQNKRAQSTHESSVGVLVGFHILQVCGYIKHVVELVALHSCH